MIQALSVEGSRLDNEPSTKSTSTVDGSTPDTRTIRDSGPKHGRFSFGHRTIHNIDLQRGRFSFGHRTVHDIDLQRGWFNT